MCFLCVLGGGGASWEAQAESRDGVSLLIFKSKHVHQAGKRRDE